MATPPGTSIDHLVILAPDLDTGARLVEGALGVAPLPGGRHDAMATHNLLLGMGPEYLEVLSPDPSAEPPHRARWFGLDQWGATFDPVLAAWVVRTDDLGGTLAASPIDLGEPVDLARGDLRWRISVRPDGAAPLGGLAPAVIEWAGPPPEIPDSGVRLVSLTLAGPDAALLRATLEALRLDAPVTVREDLFPHVIAAFDTPQGPRFITGIGGDAIAIDVQRQIAVDLVSLTWSLLDRVHRSPAGDAAMVRVAESSLWHWSQVGSPTEQAIAEWQCSRVRATLGEGAPALEHAERCLRLSSQNRVDDIVPASAHEALARAYAVLGERDAALEQRNLSYRIAVDLDEDDRVIIEHDLATLPLD
ncbi:MAG: VOC family protein [bacterium]